MNAEQQLAFDRIRRIDWANAGRGEFRPGIHELLGAWASVVNEIAFRHGAKAAFPSALYGVVSILQQLGNTRHKVPEEVLAWIDESFIPKYPRRGSGLIACALADYVLWGALPPEDRARIAGDANVENPHGQLVDFFEAGGAFTSEHNMLDTIYPLTPEDAEFDRQRDSLRANALSENRNQRFIR